ncbi:MAG: U32 family peptidase, partial [Clostridia bacterium]|nr:U32 family peptidase [Clostridia bacterium]
MELLSPAGSPEALGAALRCGADAVYLGLTRFNARQGAANFDEAAFRAAVTACHERGVAVHVTLNTLAGQGELPALLDTAALLCEAGADAAIVQDVGLARLLHEAAPALSLHASTQLSIHTPAALPLLKAMGFSRVVLAREMSQPEIADAVKVARSLGMETEVFVHGALCMCLSGQCLMSAVIGRRSGNRGRCAQPCRLAFADGSYPLSLKDLSLLDRLDELEASGVTSLKIEGRSKLPEYVAAATAAFRRRLDGEAP